MTTEPAAAKPAPVIHGRSGCRGKDSTPESHAQVELTQRARYQPRQIWSTGACRGRRHPRRGDSRSRIRSISEYRPRLLMIGAFANGAACRRLFAVNPIDADSVPSKSRPACCCDLEPTPRSPISVATEQRVPSSPNSRQPRRGSVRWLRAEAWHHRRCGARRAEGKSALARSLAHHQPGCMVAVIRRRLVMLRSLPVHGAVTARYRRGVHHAVVGSQQPGENAEERRDGHLDEVAALSCRWRHDRLLPVGRGVSFITAR